MLNINKIFITLMVLIPLLVIFVYGDTYRVTNDETTYTIVYTDYNGYTMVYTTVKCINTLRALYSEQKISKIALIERTNIAIKNLKRVSGIVIH